MHVHIQSNMRLLPHPSAKCEIRYWKYIQGWGTVRGMARLRLPSREQAQRRLELDSGLAHRPLSTRGDPIAAGAADRDSAALWEVHQRRLSAKLRALRSRLPRAGLAAVDPFALRAALILLLAIGLAAGGPDWPQRLKRAVTPWGSS